MTRALLLVSLVCALFTLPSAAWAATAQCQSADGKCIISNDDDIDFMQCDCDGGGVATTGGMEWVGLSEDELMEICWMELEWCSINEGETTIDPEPTTSTSTSTSTTTEGETETGGISDTGDTGDTGVTATESSDTGTGSDTGTTGGEDDTGLTDTSTTVDPTSADTSGETSDGTTGAEPTTDGLDAGHTSDMSAGQECPFGCDDSAVGCGCTANRSGSQGLLMILMMAGAGVRLRRRAS